MSTRHGRTELRRRAVALLDQQLWCWGRDIARPEGNVLLGLGMCRYRSSDSGHDRSVYTGRVAGDGVVWLWGFGVLFCLPERGGVFLRRYGFDPLLIEHPLERPVFAPEEFHNTIRPSTARQQATVEVLVRAAAGWMAAYEHWITENFGLTYRESALAARSKPAAVPAGDMASAWEHLAKKSVRLSTPTATTGPWGRFLATLHVGSVSCANTTQRKGPIRRTTTPQRSRPV
ncbi:MAG: hypothetical protein U0792_12815 [Gemmataceae bacterium]